MPPRRPASPTVILVAVAAGALLTGVAGTGAYLGVSRYLAADPAPTGPGDGDGSPTGTDATAAQVPCPQETIAAVRQAGGLAELVIVVYARGPQVAGGRVGLEGEAWICRDSDGELYYQGHDLDGRPPVEGDNGKLIGQGVNGRVTQDGSTYVATQSDGGDYRLNCDQGDLRTSGGTVWQVACTAGDGPSTFSSDDTG